MASPPPGGGGGKILGLKPRTAIIAGGGILAAALGYMWWRGRKASSAAASSASASSSTTGAYGVDQSGELSVLQSELEDLLAAQGQDTDTTTGTGGGGGTGGGSGCPAGQVKNAAGKCVPDPAKKPPPKKKEGKPGMPASVRATKTTASSVTLSWTKAPNATSYRVRVTYQGKLVGSEHTVNGTSATISGLHPAHTYTFHVAAVGPGGTSAETNGPAVKTKI
jgi:Fibronectin type III domain